MFGKSPFGTSSTTSAFGTGSSLFGSTPTKPTVGFGTQPTTQSTGLFGQKPLFGSSTPQQTSIFGSQPTSTASSSLFGQSKPLFGGTTTQSAFGGTTSLFGSTQQTGQSGGLFGSGFGASTVSGTTVKFEPPTATDTMLRNGTNQTISTKHMCITAMKQYEGKSLEELRCEDYLANRKGTQTTGLTFGQTSQPATSTGLFGATTTTQQTSLFGQNKPLFGSSFGTTATSTPSLFGSQPTASTSLFGSKPAGGLFGSSTTSTASPFGQTQTSTGLFGAKPATGFGTQPTLFGGSSVFGSTTTTASPFTFGSTTSTASPFGQTQQPATSGFGFGQTTTSTASTGLFGAKPATTGFGGFGTTATSSPFGTQSTGLFGAKPATGGLFGSTTGGLFGSTPAASSAPSLFGSTAAKPTTSLFGTPAAQPAFGAAPAASTVVAAPAAPIVLGADVSQTLIQNALLEAQIAASPYGDSPLLKLLSQESLDKANIPNPTSVERQMRFLASITRGTGAVTTTSASGPSALGSIPAAGSRISIPVAANKTRNSPAGEFTYRPMFSPPNLDGSLTSSPIVNLNNTANRSSILKNSTLNGDISALDDENDNDLGLQNPKRSHVKRLDLAVVHKALQESKNRSSSSSSSATKNVSFGTVTDITDQQPSTHKEPPLISALKGGGDRAAQRLSESQTGSVTGKSPETNEGRRGPCPDQGPLRLDFDAYSPDVTADSVSERPPTVASNKETSSPPQKESPPEEEHPAKIILRRRDYHCDPSLRELAELAKCNDGVCHIESGFTISRLGFGSVFWPGPFDLSNINLDEVVHFRQHEVIVYPDDSNKPPIGEQLNRFAEISLERVWPRDKKTKEPITDPVRLEKMGFRAKLERASAKMDATFKDYRPDTGTWVFTVPHFTKYGLLDDSDDEEMPSPEQLRASLNDSRTQFAVQRARLPLVDQKQLGDMKGAASSNQVVPTGEDASEEKREVISLTDSKVPDFTEGLGGSLAMDTAKRSVLHFDAPEFASSPMDAFTPRTRAIERKHKAEHEESSSLLDASCKLDELMEDSIMMQRGEEREEEYWMQKIEPKCVQPANELGYLVEEGRSILAKIKNIRTGLIDAGIVNGRRIRVGWAPGLAMMRSGLPQSFSIEIQQFNIPDDVPSDYLVDMFEHNIRLSTISYHASGDPIFSESSYVPRLKPSKDYAQMIDCFKATSEQCSMNAELSIWKLCDALFTDPSLQNAGSDYQRIVKRRECVGRWLKEAIAEKHGEAWPASGNLRTLMHVFNGDLDGAVNEAIKSKRPLLAIALATFQHSSRAPYKEQIKSWVSRGADEYIDESLLKIYMIMAGETCISVRGRKMFVNEGLDWMRALGVFVWYFTPMDASLGDVIAAFEADLDARGDKQSLENNVCYELMKLASNRSHPVEQVVEPAAFTEHHFDYHLSWHLWCVLRSLGFARLHESAEHSVHIGYAEQLARLRLYHLAVFVLMHLNNDTSRQDMVREMVDRIALDADEKMYDKIAQTCPIPQEIIAHSKYMRAKALSNEEDMCRYALDAGMFDEAHSLFADAVGPKTVTLEEFETLERFCEYFGQKSDRIAGWAPRGQVYTDFCLLRDSYRQIEDDTQIEGLLELAHSLGPRLSSFVPKSPIQEISITVMSRLVYEVIYRFENKQLTGLPLSKEDMLDISSGSASEVSLLL